MASNMTNGDLNTIDVNFDFTTDSTGYWEGFWDRNEGLGYGGSDPDSSSPTLHKYHQLLWSRELPNGEQMDLKMGSGPYYLTWKDFRFGSDAIIVGFRYKKYSQMIHQVMECVGDYKAYYEDLIRRSYSIGGVTIFPKHPLSMNQNKGTNSFISDRWDLTLECIRRYYKDEQSPLYETIERDKEFYELFLDFKGYVDYFFFQDMVSDDYSKVDIWCGNTDFVDSGLPKTLDEYFEFIKKEFEFLDKRNARIKEFCEAN